MVFRVASIGTEVLDLNNAADNFGNDNDVLIINDSYGTPFIVAAYAGNDVIVMNQFSVNNFTQVYGGIGNDRIFGSIGSEAISDGNGDDFVYGGGGKEDVYADRGNDYYDGGGGNTDFIHFDQIDSNGFGASNNFTGVTVDLAITGVQNLGVFGLDTIVNFEGVFGSQGNDVVSGDEGANGLEGRGGDDQVFGRGGNDDMYGFSGSDTLNGGMGADHLSIDDGGGPAARDVAAYTAIAESGTKSTTRDTIFSFDAGGLATDDKIDLSAIDANPFAAGNQAFVFVGAFTAAAGEVRVSLSGGGTLVSVDTDFDSKAEMTIFLANVTGITAVDFIL